MVKKIFYLSALISQFYIIDASPLLADEYIMYGTRVGQVVTITGAFGLDTRNATITFEHTLRNAAEFCELYEGDGTMRCVEEHRQDMARLFVGELWANCESGEWIDVFGNRFKYEGEGENASGYQIPLIRSVARDEILPDCSACGFFEARSALSSLCPSTFPW